MRVERERIRLTLYWLGKLNEEELGMQPRLALGCFYDLNREDDEYCSKNCGNFSTCIFYLKGFEEETNPWKRRQRELIKEN
jgi:hypothetical protein